jgi:protein O-mannosyl-transferase
MNRPKKQPATLPVERSDFSSRLLLILPVLLLFATLLVYSPVWRFGLVIVDDPAYVSENPHILEGITLESVKWSWTTFHDSNWIPLTWLSLMLDTDLYGGRVGGYHFTNTLLHAANAVLLFLALAAATQAHMKSAFTAALFALHPLHVESVAWVAERKDVLSTLFGLLSLLEYVRYATRGGIWRLAASFVFLVLSLLSKQTLVTLPFVFLLLDYWPLDRIKLGRSVPPAASKPAPPGRRPAARAAARADRALSNQRRSILGLIVEKLPFFTASVGFSAAALMAQSHGGAVIALTTVSFANRCTNAIVAYATYLGKTIFPQSLAIYYPHLREGLNSTEIGLAAVLLLTITATAIACVRRYPFLFVGWFWYVGTLVPMIGLVQIGSQQMADRYTYVPLIGIFLGVTWLVPELVPAGLLRTRVLPAVAFASLVLLATTTYGQISYWHDSVTLLQHSMECTSDNPLMHQFLGSAYLAEGSTRDGAEELEKAVRLAPAHVSLHIQLGDALQLLGRLDEAAAQYRQALALDSHSAQAHSNLGLIFFKQHEHQQARQEYRRALEIEPDFPSAHTNLAALCFTTADYAGAIAHSERVLRQYPDSTNSQMCIAMALRAQGHLDDAIRRIEHVLELKPQDPVAREELARTLAIKNGTANTSAASQQPKTP